MSLFLGQSPCNEPADNGTNERPAESSDERDPIGWDHRFPFSVTGSPASLTGSMLRTGQSRTIGLAAVIAEIDALCDREKSIACEIIATPARTIGGLKVKARVIERCHSGEEIYLNQEQTTDVRLAQSIIDDLLAQAVVN